MNAVPFPDQDGKTTADDDWDEIIPLGGRGALPPFPVHVLPDWAADMVTGVGEETQTPVDIAAGILLGAFATAAGGKVVVQGRGMWTEPTNLFLAMVAEPGTRKSAVLRAISTPLFDAERALRDRSRDKRREAEALRVKLEEADRVARAAAKSGEAGDLAEAVSAAAALEEADIPAEVQLIAKNVTAEECTTLLAEQGGRLAVLSAEGDLFDIVCGRYSNGVPALTPFLEGHAGDVVKVNRRGRSEYVESPALTVAVCIQPSVLNFIAEKPRLRGQGLLARFLFAIPPDLVGHRRAEPALISDDVRDTYAKNLKALVLSLAEWDKAVSIDLTDEARKRITEFANEIEPRLRAGEGDLETLRDWASKLAGACVRIAGLLHVATHLTDGYQKPIAEDTMLNAITVGRYFVAHSAAAFGVMISDPRAERAHAVLKWLGRDPERKEFTQRDIHRSMQSKFTSVKEIGPALDLLTEHGYIRLRPPADDEPRRGRPPSPTYQIHPNLNDTP